ncbi:unnamed protein product [Sphenostylis stenocarpa]|uniref:Uncharacterized protein n=1 Tax=Sphenostylis stenocarpa TaxID=92480 RepID=A0AA86SJI4_9FABA|nr:unnamed protein product [Sphenostylis stenocarpa]
MSVGESPNSAFEFPTLICNSPLQRHVVFCGKIIHRQPQPSSRHPFMTRSNSYEKWKPVRPADRGQRWASLQFPDTGHSRKYVNGLFGVVKFPVQMELSDIRKRQSAQSARLAAAADGEPQKDVRSGLEWQLIRTLRRKSRHWLNALAFVV